MILFSEYPQDKKKSEDSKNNSSDSSEQSAHRALMTSSFQTFIEEKSKSLVKPSIGPSHCSDDESSWKYEDDQKDPDHIFPSLLQ